MSKNLLISLSMLFAAGTSGANTSVVTINDAHPDSGNPYYYRNLSEISPETHVIGVYQTRSDHSTYHPVGQAHVHVTGTSNFPVNLVLSSHEPTQWILDGEGTSFIGSILLNGYYASTVIGVDSAQVIDRSGMGNFLAACAVAWPIDTGGCDTPALVAGVQNVYGLPITSFSGAYHATSFSVALAPVPEPSSAALALIGLLFSAVARQRTVGSRRKGDVQKNDS